jgi:capsular polysaccharide transport system permease protein
MNWLNRGVAVQWRTIRALMIRDMMLRYGRDNIGFAWVILEPMILTAGVMVIWSLTHSGDTAGIKVVEFVLTGYMPLTLWRHLTNSMVCIFRRSAPLLYHRSVSLLDIVMSKACLEFLGTTLAFLAVWGPLDLLGIVSDVADWTMLILGWVMMGAIGLAAGLLIAALTEISESAERFVQPAQYLAIPLSGAFALTDWLPVWAQHLILFNPLVHCYEVFRAGYFGDTIVVHYSFAYYFGCTFCILFAGVFVVAQLRGKIRLS